MVIDNDEYLKATIRQAMSAPLLSIEEERSLMRRWVDDQDERALGKLTRAHMRMAVSTAIKFRGYGLPLADLIQEGAIGLLEAAKRFDPDREVRFCTYAGWWIRASMQDYILRNWSIVRVGSKSAHKTIFFNLSRIRSMIEDADTAPRTARIKAAERFNVSESDIEFMTSRLGRRDQSLNAMLTDDGDIERQDLIPDEREGPDSLAEGTLDQARRKSWIGKALKTLSNRERMIIEHRFFTEEKMTLSRLGDDLSLSKERVRQIEKQAMGKLKACLAAEASEEAI
ncbi:RNA polymerase sigma-70 factor family protein [Parvularcula bermudensis HTCC2503]|uniref:RNA polymerase sigma-70 factor family protein n=1 Tax=Parvularcula bermudensis (strain ATCC BAA-594 / HTCC2503 / KCTC 12087) TaxID=314260 RepID=E0TCZ7_PARBH|nr:RNA polymerase factor sigma-32 [Parvularcula bermudensis]ADM08656.1 RNA polymerase sigma-70 factor family protein [Parvularcula bermudensis HTCC2503]